jgi:hypothetical protein
MRRDSNVEAIPDMPFAERSRLKVIFTIELELALHQQTTQNAALLEDYTDLLLKLSSAYEIPVTWAVSDPAFSAAREAIVQSSLAHEIALLGDATWTGLTAGRARFARELTRRVSAAGEQGIAVRSLVLRDAEPDDNLDLLREHGIRGLRLAPQSTRDAAVICRFGRTLGIEVLPVTWSVGAPRSWWSGWRPRALGDAALREARHGVCVISLRGDHLIEEDRALRDLTALWEISAYRRDRGAIELCTLANAVTENEAASVAA